MHLILDENNLYIPCCSCRLVAVLLLLFKLTMPYHFRALVSYLDMMTSTHSSV